MTRNATQEQRWDHARDLAKHEWRPGDRAPIDQRLAVAALVGQCESLVGAGVLTEPAEKSLRVLIAQTLVAFDMPSKAELRDVVREQVA